MKLIDVNVWLALTLSAHAFHAAVRHWLLTQRGDGELLFCRATQQSFLRLLTTPAVLGRYGNPPLTNADAWGVYEGLLGDSRIAYAAEPDGLEDHWRRLAVRDTASPKMWMDAYLAAFARAQACQLVTLDAAFREYEGLDLLLLARP